MQTFVAQVKRLPAADRDAILGSIPRSTWQEVDAAGLLGWLPLSVNLACTGSRALSAVDREGVRANGTMTFVGFWKPR